MARPRPGTAESQTLRQSRGAKSTNASKARLGGNFQRAYDTEMLTNLDVQTLGGHADSP